LVRCVSGVVVVVVIKSTHTIPYRGSHSDTLREGTERDAENSKVIP
jgi:hypothetical protein